MGRGLGLGLGTGMDAGGSVSSQPVQGLYGGADSEQPSYLGAQLQSMPQDLGFGKTWDGAWTREKRGVEETGVWEDKTCTVYRKADAAE